jgi:hypothetical protein
MASPTTKGMDRESYLSLLEVQRQALFFGGVSCRARNAALMLLSSAKASPRSNRRGVGVSCALAGAVFVLLWTPEMERHASDYKKDLSFRHRPLFYWLDYVRAFAGLQSPVLLVQSKCDTPADRAVHAKSVRYPILAYGG